MAFMKSSENISKDGIKPSKNILTQAYRGNLLLWRSMFWQTWNRLPLDEKLTWIVFVGQTVAVLTLLEFVILKK